MRVAVVVAYCVLKTRAQPLCQELGETGQAFWEEVEGSDSNFVVIAHSNGGALAWEAATFFPEKCKGAIWVASCPALSLIEPTMLPIVLAPRSRFALDEV